LLKQLIANDPLQVDRTDKLRELLNESFAKSSAEIDARRSGGFSEAAALCTRGESDQVTHEIYAILVDFEEKERDRLTLRAETTRWIGAATSLAILVLSSITFVALVAAVWAIFRDIAA